MSDEVSLREYIESKFTALEKSTELSRLAMEKRLDSMNEFRQQLKDQSSSFIPRIEYSLAQDRICDDVKFLRESRAELVGKASQISVNITMAIAILGLLLAAVGLILRLKGA